MQTVQDAIKIGTMIMVTVIEVKFDNSNEGCAVRGTAFRLLRDYWWDVVPVKTRAKLDYSYCKFEELCIEEAEKKIKG